MPGWLYSQYENKYDFVSKMYPRFKDVQAHIGIKTNQMTPGEVFGEVLKRSNGFVNSFVK